MASFHEDFTRETRTSGPSDGSFGVVFTVACLAAGLLPLRHGRPVRVLYLIASAAFLLITFIRPSLLHYPNRVWLACGRLLGKVMNPILTALLFYLVFTPAGFLFRLFRKDPLGLAFDSGAASYWSARAATTPEQGDESGMANQF